VGRAPANGGQAVTDLPQAAIDAVAQALRHPPDGAGMTLPEWDHARAVAAVKAAAPHLYAAERERIRRLAQERLDALGAEDFSPAAQALADVLTITQPEENP
jgi:hypothetical protein